MHRKLAFHFGVKTLLKIFNIFKLIYHFSALQAIDVWMGACTAFIFAALIEFTVVNYLWRRRKFVQTSGSSLKQPKLRPFGSKKSQNSNDHQKIELSQVFQHLTVQNHLINWHLCTLAVLGKYFPVMAVLEFEMIQITNNTNLTLHFLTNFASLTLTMPEAIFSSPKTNRDLQFLHVLPDGFIKKIPKLVKINIGSFKSH